VKILVGWCGICFAWRRCLDGRCVECGNLYMRDIYEKEA
jgi:hypothetical protein